MTGGGHLDSRPLGQVVVGTGWGWTPEGPRVPAQVSSSTSCHKLYKHPATPFLNSKSDTHLELGGATAHKQNPKIWHDWFVPQSALFAKCVHRHENQQTELTPADSSSRKICDYIRCLVGFLLVRFVFFPQALEFLCRKEKLSAQQKASYFKL